MERPERARVWVGVDGGKAHHWAAAVDETGAQVWSKKISNGESAILDAIGEAFVLAETVQWAVDIAGTSRLRRDLAVIGLSAQLAADLALLTTHRADLVADPVRLVNRLRDVPTGVFPALERAFDYSSHKGALVLLTGYQTIESMPGIGPILGAEFVVAAGDLTAYAGRLASAAGLVPVPRDSGRRTGNLHRPKRYNRRLRRVLYLSAQSSIIRPGPNRDFYLKKRGQGLKHTQAVIAPARRRVDVL